MHVAFIRHVGPYDQVGQAWTRLMGWAGQRVLLGPKMTLVGVCHDDPAVTPPAKVRYDACLVVGDSVGAEGEVGVQDVGGGRYAVCRHEGPYQKLGETYRGVCGQWLPTSGEEARSAPALEFYRNSPMDTPPEKLLTDVCMPVA